MDVHKRLGDVRTKGKRSNGEENVGQMSLRVSAAGFLGIAFQVGKPPDMLESFSLHSEDRG